MKWAWLEPGRPVVIHLSGNSHGVLIRTWALKRSAILGAHLTPANSLKGETKPGRLQAYRVLSPHLLSGFWQMVSKGCCVFYHFSFF